MYDLPFLYITLSWVLQDRRGSFTVMELTKCGGNSKFKIFGEINTILGILATFCNKKKLRAKW